MAKILPVGKLDSDILQKIIFDNIIYKRPEVTTRAGIGEDCAAIDFGEFDCITSTDPITASVNDIGRLSIHISCNDIATNGVQPVAILLTVLLPEGTTEEDVAHIMKQAASAAADCQVEIAGGHTEITRAVNQPVICSTAFGRVPKAGKQSAHDMVVGDKIYVTKALALEGTGIIASEKGDEILAAGVLSEAELAHARSMLDRVSVVREGVLAGSIGTHGMHDITEGGILGAVWEMCDISGLGARLYEDRLPFDPVTFKLADHFGFNPLRMISSGSMLILAPSGAEDAAAGSVTGAVTNNVAGSATGGATNNAAGSATGAVTNNVAGSVTGGATNNTAGSATGAVTNNVAGSAEGSPCLRLEKAFAEAGIELTCIGEILPASEGIRLVRSGAAGNKAGAACTESAAGNKTGAAGDKTGAAGELIDPPSADEIYRVIK